MSTTSMPSRTPTLASNASKTKLPLSDTSHSHTSLPRHDTAAARNGSVSAPASSGASTPTKRRSGNDPKPGMVAPLQLSRWRFWAIFISLMISIFLFALDQLILATAIPKITEAFNSLTELSWLASGFFLTLLGFNLIYSQWAQIFPSKHVIIFAVFIFELGSLVSAVAPNMRVLILGRAICGVGGAGIFSGGMLIIAEITALHERAQYMGLFGVVFALASIIGPLIGGAFSDHVSWRWCFYINLPFGGIALACLIFFQPLTPPLGRAKTYKGYDRNMLLALAKCDWLGVAIVMAWGCCVILFTQWGGVTKSWSDGSVIACAVMSGVIIPIFFGWEWWLGENAMFKLHLLRRRTMVGSAIVLFFLFATFMFEVYYLSIGMQAAYNLSATDAGVRLLPFILTQIIILIASSRIIPKIGRFKYIIATGPVFIAIGSGLLYTVKYGTPIQHLFGFQVFLGVGIGLSMQNTMLAVQFELKKEPWLISAGVGMATFLGFAGRVIGISLAGSVFGNMLQVYLAKYAPDLPPQYLEAVVNSPAAVWDIVPEIYREQCLIAYTETLRAVYIIGVPCAILAFCGALVIRNSKMQTKAEEEEAIRKAREEAAAEENGETPADAEKHVKEAVQAEREAEEAVAMTAVEPVPQAAVEGGADARAVVGDRQVKSAV